MKLLAQRPGFALVVTLMLMAFIVVLIVGYLAATRTDRSTSSVYANRLKAKMIADSGLAAATNLLREHTKNGNYITAMPAPVPTPAWIRTEIYRPVPSADPDEFLKIDNAIGDVLASRVDPTAPLSAQADPRPTLTPIPAAGAGGSFGIADPEFDTTDSYDFNQVIRVGSNDAGRLVEAASAAGQSARPAFGQWVRVRDSAGELIGRYAFFVEDESMRVNVNFSGNNRGSPNMRTDDAAVGSTPSPVSQIEEIDPSAILPANARAGAIAALVPLGPPGQRLSTKLTTALLGTWEANAPDRFAEIITSLSKDDDTTARGWHRMNLNKVVADASTPADAARTISNWVLNAWTGPQPISTLQTNQLFNDERLRMQVAANIVDYIDVDSTPTEVLRADGSPYDPRVLGIEKIPYLTEVDAVYKSTLVAPGEATVALSFRFKFQNLFDQDLPLEAVVRKIRVRGAPAVIKNSDVVFDPGDQWIEVAVPSSGVQGTVPWGPDQDGRAGAKTFTTPVRLTQTGTYRTTPNSVARLEAGVMDIEVLGVGDKPLDVTRITTSDREAKFQDASPALTYDFLENSRQAASINVTSELVPPNTVLNFGDPRYRPLVVAKRWYNLSRTDEARVNTFVDEAEQNSRTFAVDWYDNFGNRPFLFHRNGPMQSVGELGNVSACEYPWRTLYFQHPDRPANTTQVGPATDVPLRRSNARDYVLADLFTTSDTPTRSGSLNINGQPRSATSALNALFLGVPVGAERLSDVSTSKITFDPGSLPPGPPNPITVNAVGNRRNAVGPPPENNPKRPFFTIGELAPVLSRLTSWSNGTSVSSRSAVAYSVLTQNANYRRDVQVEQAFRKVSSATTTRGNVFRVLFVGQSIKDINRDGAVQTPDDDPTYRGPNERTAEYLGEAFVERTATFATPVVINGSAVTKTSDSTYRVIAQRVISE